MPRTFCLFITVLLSACAASPSKTHATQTATEAQLNALYGELTTASARFDNATALYQNGQSTEAATEFGAGRAALRDIGNRCAALSNCDVRRVLAAQDALLERQARFLAGATADAQPVDAATDDTAGEGDSPVLQQMPAAKRTVAMLNGRDLAQVIELNEPVKAALEEWLTWMRPQLLDTWENYQYMRHRMFPEYQKAGLPEALLFGIMAKESGGRVHAVSRAGAAGPLQFMPATAARFGLTRGGAGFDLRYDPREAARANAEYLNERFSELNNNLYLALAAYNGGEGRIARLSGNGAKDFWNPQVFNALPPETREYVPMVLAAAWLFLHPRDYNLSLAQYDASPVPVKLKQAISINELTVCIGQSGNPRGWFRHLRNLNPRWQADERIAAGTDLELPAAALDAYLRQCETQGPMLAMSRDLHQARPPAPPVHVASPARTSGAGNYVVKKGDSIHGIAKRHGCSVAALAKINGIHAPKYVIKPGQRLSLSACRA